MVRPVSVVRTDVSEEPSPSISVIIHVTLIMKTLGSSETSVLTRATQRHSPEDGILQCFIFYEIRKIRTVFTAAHHLNLSHLLQDLSDVQLRFHP
jgi:hypothetical protein